MDPGIGPLLLSILVLTVAAAMQAATGLGAGMIAFPLIALISIELVPGPLIFASILLSVYMAWRGWQDIRFASIKLLFYGIMAGTVIGGLSMKLIPVDSLGIFFGLLLLTVVMISIFGHRMTYTTTNVLSLGTAAGFMGITVASGSPFVALLYQNEKAATIRATLAYIYLLAGILTLFVLNAIGRFGQTEFLHGLYLAPGMLLGFLVSGKLAATVDRGYSRTIILVVSSLSALALIIKHA